MYIVLLIVPFCPSAEFKTRCFVFRTGPGGGTSGDNKIEAAAEEDKEANGGAAAASAAAQEVPTKCVSNVMKIQIKAQIQYIDFEGRADGETRIFHFLTCTIATSLCGRVTRLQTKKKCLTTNLLCKIC